MVLVLILNVLVFHSSYYSRPTISRIFEQIHHIRIHFRYEFAYWTEYSPSHPLLQYRCNGILFTFSTYVLWLWSLLSSEGLLTKIHDDYNILSSKHHHLDCIIRTARNYILVKAHSGLIFL